MTYEDDAPSTQPHVAPVSILGTLSKCNIIVQIKHPKDANPIDSIDSIDSWGPSSLETYAYLVYLSHAYN